jgi:alpha-L-fucosidase
VRQSADAPTAALDPREIDRTGREASQKYDEARKEILERVDKIDQQAPTVPTGTAMPNSAFSFTGGFHSVPAFGKRMVSAQYVPEGHGRIPTPSGDLRSPYKFGYKDFLPMFRAVRFDPAAWARLFKQAGASYLVPVFEHHDGGPHRDLWGDLAKAVRAEELHLGACSHRIEHNVFLGLGRDLRSDINDPQNAALYGPAHVWLEAKNGTPLSNHFTFVSHAWTNHWLARSAEIHPDTFFRAAKSWTV